MYYSQYAFVEGFTNEKELAWITVHIHMFEFFGGVTPILAPDYASTAVDYNNYDWYSPKLIRAYHRWLSITTWQLSREDLVAQR